MKELTIEQKAKSYDEAIKRGLDYIRHTPATEMVTRQDIFEAIFPEFKEPKDERIKREILELVSIAGNGNQFEEIKEWLEEQGEKKASYTTMVETGDGGINALVTRELPTEGCDDEQKHVDEAEPKFHIGDKIRIFRKGAANEEPMTITKIDGKGYWSGDLFLCNFTDADRLKLVEQKPADKVEPMFNEGDWVVYDHRTYQVVELPKEGYINLGLRRNGKVEFAPSPYCRHWTIQDAKDGDVLCYETKDDFIIFIYKNGHIHYHCCYSNGHLTTIDSFFVVPKYLLCYIHPATKEQCDLLFTNMKEAGWAWDNEKKGLKKLEPKFNVGDWIVTEDSFGKIVRHIDVITSNIINEGYGVSDENGLIYNISFDSEHKWHKWTIRDAEDGDVLASELTGFIFLFKGIKGDKIEFYCDYDTRLEWPESEHDDRFAINDDPNQYYGRVEKSQDIHPATKEQRDLLFEKMKEEGYEWDGEKKELKKIEVKTLDPGKVIEWLRKNTCTGCWGDKADTAISQRIDRFKKDFKL